MDWIPCREMRNLDGEEYKKMPIIALSANTVETSREEILTSGFNDVIVKPIELDQAESHAEDLYIGGQDKGERHRAFPVR